MDGGMNGSGSRESLGSSGQSWQDEARDVLGGSPSTSSRYNDSISTTSFPFQAHIPMSLSAAVDQLSMSSTM